MSKVIKGGTVVTADRAWKADVLVEGETIKAIGADLTGDETIDATDAYVMPGGIDPHTHLEMPFMGTTAAETFDSGTFAAASGGTTMLVDFVPAGAGRVDREGDGGLGREVGAARSASTIGWHHVAICGWNETLHRRDGGDREAGGEHLQALHGLQGRADDRRRRDVRVVPPLRRAGRAAAGACRERRHRRGAAEEVHGGGRDRAGGARVFAPAGGGGRGGEPGDHDRGCGGGAALHRACVLRAGARGDPAGAGEGDAGLWRAADPAPDARRGRVLPQGLGLCGAAGDVAAVPVEGAPGEPVGGAAVGVAAGGGDRSRGFHDAAEAHGPGKDFRRSRTGPAGWRTGCRCSGPKESRPGG